MVRYFLSLIVRWLVNSVSLYLAIFVIGHVERLPQDEIPKSIAIVLISGLAFSIVNSLLRPIAIILSLPAILLTLGLFTLVVNGFIVWFSLLLVPGIHLSFLNSILAGIILGIINFVITNLIEFRTASRRNHHENANA